MYLHLYFSYDPQLVFFLDINGDNTKEIALLYKIEKPKQTPQYDTLVFCWKTIRLYIFH